MGATVLVTFVVTDLATLPSQCWLTRLARRIPKNNIERGEGGKTRIFFDLVVKCNN